VGAGSSGLIMWAAGSSGLVMGRWVLLRVDNEVAGYSGLVEAAGPSKLMMGAVSSSRNNIRCLCDTQNKLLSTDSGL
jgi:hypothetical protein